MTRSTLTAGMATLALALLCMRAAAQPLFPDAGFQPGAGFTGGSPNNLVSGMVVLPDGRILAGGSFLQYNGATAGRIARLLPTGQLDPDFQTGTGFNGSVLAVAVQPDGRVLASGDFTTYQGLPCSKMVRLMPNGDLDGTFTPYQPYQAFITPRLRDIEVLPDGSFIGCGSGGVWRFEPNGSFDLSVFYEPATGIVEEIALLPDGRLIAVGDMDRDMDDNVIGVRRYLADGSLDPAFTPPAGVLGAMTSVAPGAGGAAVVGGAPDAGGQRLFALLADGQVDPGFNNTAYRYSDIRSLMFEDSGDLLVGMALATGPVNCEGVCRVRPTGALDPACDANTNGVVSMLAGGTGGRLYMAGSFASAVGMACAGITRVQRSGLALRLKVFLGGAWLGAGLMRDALGALNLIPATEPYTALGFVQAGGGGGETTNTAVLRAGGDANVTDWIMVEARSAAAPQTVLATQCALVQVDGEVVSANGAPLVTLPLVPGAYHIVVRHRNHLAAMTADPTPVVDPGTPVVIDLSLPGTATYGTNARQNNGGVMALWAGDTQHNGNLQYIGLANDRDPILVAIGSNTPTNVAGPVYSTRDTTMNGLISYTGVGNDRDPILLNIGSVLPTNIRLQQLP